MAVADATVKPSRPPPPPRIVVAALALVPFVLAPMLALVRVVGVAARALPYLFYAVVWVLSAASAAMVVVGRAWGQGSASFVFLQALADAALKVLFCGTFLLLALAAVVLCCTFLGYVFAVLSGSVPEFKKSALGGLKKDSTRGIFPRTALLGYIASMPFHLLIFAGCLMETMMSSPVKGSISKGEMVGSVILDVGVFGTGAISCSVVIPALALDCWRKDRSDRDAGLAV